MAVRSRIRRKGEAEYDHQRRKRGAREQGTSRGSGKGCLPPGSGPRADQEGQEGWIPSQAAAAGGGGRSRCCRQGNEEIDSRAGRARATARTKKNNNNNSAKKEFSYFINRRAVSFFCAHERLAPPRPVLLFTRRLCFILGARGHHKASRAISRPLEPRKFGVLNPRMEKRLEKLKSWENSWKFYSTSWNGRKDWNAGGGTMTFVLP